MKKLAILLLISISFPLTLAQKHPTDGTIVDGIYTNNYFNFSFKVPKNGLLLIKIFKINCLILGKKLLQATIPF